ncbi:glutamate-rich protein 3-like isoform X2 [Centruroides sculpturatus]|uniref:glutamate-rich protein 3-like isoform X2 n=1 Tax=Centruroides sculpturatus TaxID=218467 RepID=UPI000C6D91DF|nr:glutamate-rich protein 3-like isoform X2 [Centruroides sculpturatus]
MWTVAATKKKLTGPLGTYNSLTDQHLTHYFKKPTVKRQLTKAGLINKQGNIIPDSVRKLEEIKQQQQKEAHELLANAIVQKTLELERLRQAEIKHHLDDMNKIELVERVKSARGKSKKKQASLPYQSAYNLSYSADSLNLPQLSTNKGYNWNKSSFSLNYNLPNYILENNKIDDKINEEYLLNNKHFMKKGSSAKLHKERKNENFDNQRSKSAGAKLKNSDSLNQIYKDAFKVLLKSPISPYLLPVLSKAKSMSSIQRNTSAKCKSTKKNKSGCKSKKNSNQQKFSETIEEPTAVNLYEAENNNNIEYFKIKKPVLQVSESQCRITLCFHGAMSMYAWIIPQIYQEVHISQQHCGGNSICVFKKQLQAEDIFTFVSRRHRGYPFSITIFIDGIRHFRLSTCCEYRYQRGSKLGGKRGQFTLIDVQGSKPCFRCQVEESLGIYRPRHPPPPKYTKTLQKKLKNSINGSSQKSERSITVDSFDKSKRKTILFLILNMIISKTLLCFYIFILLTFNLNKL